MTDKEPRYTYLFNDGIEQESVQDLIDVLHSHEKIDLFFATDGGLVLIMDALIHYMNQHPDLRIYATYHIMSAGFEIFRKFEGPIFLTDELDYIMIHCQDRKIFANREYDFDMKLLQKETLSRNKSYVEDLNTFNLTKKEKKKFLKGKDLYFYRKDFERLFKNKNNIKWIG